MLTLIDLLSQLKPLTWVYFQGGFRCETPFGRYLVDNDRWWGPNCTTGYACLSAEHGKQLCEADYRKRVAALFKVSERIQEHDANDIAKSA